MSAKLSPLASQSVPIAVTKLLSTPIGDGPP